MLVEDLHRDRAAEQHVLGFPGLSSGAFAETANESILTREKIADGPGHG
jgi:hypothetical protein